MYTKSTYNKSTSFTIMFSLFKLWDSYWIWAKKKELKDNFGNCIFRGNQFRQFIFKRSRIVKNAVQS